MAPELHHQHDAAAPGAIDPVCGMTVDPHTAKHRADYRGHAYYFCSAGCRTKFIAEPQKYLGARRARTCRRRHDLHLPDASRDSPGRARLVPDLRHGARTRDSTALKPGPTRSSST